MLFYFSLQNADLWKENSHLKDLTSAQAKSLQQKDQRIAELEKQLLARRKPPRDNECQTHVRRVNRILRKKGNEFDTHSNVNAPHNQQHIQRIIDGVMAIKGAPAKFSTMQITESAKFYFNSLREDAVREEHGLKTKHRKGSRNVSRKAKKFDNRLRGLMHAKCPLSKENKQKARLIMKKEYMSSDEDELLRNEVGKPARRVRHLPWMSDLANHYKMVCQDVYENHVLLQRDRKKYHYTIRDENCAVSDRAMPKDIPTWAVKV